MIDKISELRNNIKKLNDQRDILVLELNSLINSCKHKFKEIPEEVYNDWKETGDLPYKYDTTCTECKTYVRSHRCPDSPVGFCLYYSEDGFVSVGTENYPVPPNHDCSYESEDCCIFCGDPEERK